MTKKEAIALFGNQKQMAEALAISSPAISQWPEELTVAQADRVTGAAVRLARRQTGSNDDGSPAIEHVAA